MTPQRARAYAKAVLVPLVTAGVVAWSEHRAAQNKERQDAAYAVTAPALRELQDEQRRLADRIDALTALLAEHVTRHPAAGRALRAPAVRHGSGGAGVGSGEEARGMDDQVEAAERLLNAPPIQPGAQRSIPATPEAAVQEMKR